MRLSVSAFLFNPTAPSSSSAGGSATRPKDAISNRLSELRSRSEEEDRAMIAQQQLRGDDDDVADSDEERGLAEAAPRGRLQFGPHPADSEDEEGDDNHHDAFRQQMALAGATPSANVTARSLRYLVSDPKPEIKLIHRFKPGQSPSDADAEFWRSFVDKCRLAWGVFFPPKPQTSMPRRTGGGLGAWASGVGKLLLSGQPAAPVAGAASGSSLSAKQVVLNRLQMVLIADRCGVSAESLLDMKAQTLAALADYMGGDLAADVSQLEVQVSALKPSGERVTMTIGFADMLADEELRDPLHYDYEYEDDDDYFTPEEDDDSRATDIAEAPTAGLKAVRIAAVPVDQE
ncbi:hypothetical protein GPECTOR_89g480 [Gonium pectorale]|uniref:Uncharacterized protein n=1 Tax=Gonium pectorale TaxID=33097 RepID=A0A150G2C7_GONPE|nr:hypothetical protein GPECTOR_89g480 [Gonium pectorale]|eukprot:KXZ43460.1 hypothetical protein GPECTOR_89g480 [Gonium pectorale]